MFRVVCLRCYVSRSGLQSSLSGLEFVYLLYHNVPAGRDVFAGSVYRLIYV